MSAAASENPYLKLWFEEEILCGAYTPRLDMTLAIAKICVAERLAFSNGEARLCLVDMRGIRSATAEARQYLANEGSELVKAGALITGSALSRMLGNIFLMVNKPKAPLKLFTNVEEAKHWLRTQVHEVWPI